MIKYCLAFGLVLALAAAGAQAANEEPAEIQLPPVPTHWKAEKPVGTTAGPVTREMLAAPLIPADPAEAVVARMIDRVFDQYVMGNMQRVIAAYFVDKDDPGAGGLREEPFAPEIAAGKAGLRRAYAWLERWLGGNALPPHVSLVTCAAAPSLFYADWIEPIPADCPRLAALRAT